MSPGQPLFLGIDIGTQGVRAIAAADNGEVMGSSRCDLRVPSGGIHQEQEPHSWWDAVVDVIQQLGALRDAVESLAISCTSGSVCVIDDASAAIGPGLLYADPRGIPFAGADASWGIAKIAWLVENRPDLVANAAYFTSPGGYVAMKLLGGPAPIDVTQALKFGFDPQSMEWGATPVDRASLPVVVPSGTPMGTLCSAAAESTGLRSRTLVVSGATDGVAGQFACRPSPTRWAVALGSTIVWKVLAPRRIDSPSLGIYSHRGPSGWWLPGAASNAGARVLSTWATDEELAEFDQHARFDDHVEASYPSTIQGERFPFVNKDFRAWSIGDAGTIDRYESDVLGAVFVERWGGEVLVDQGCAAPESIASTGGAVSSGSWMQLRADVLQTLIEVPAEPSSAFGAAVVAAAPSAGGVIEAGDAMVRFARTIEPKSSGRNHWDDAFNRFKHRCQEQEGFFDVHS